MKPFPLVGAAYEARSRLAEAQRCVNLYPEKNPEDSPFPFTYYPTPGLTSVGAPGVLGKPRGAYRASNGVVYTVIGSKLYTIASNSTFGLVGSIAAGNNPVSMVDNRICLVIVDGSTTGYAMTLGTTALRPFEFEGADKVGYVDTYFVFNKPNTNQYFISNSNVTSTLLVGGIVASGSISAKGSGYPTDVEGPPFFYRNEPLTGGSGTGATANITVTAGKVTKVDLRHGGTGYEVGDTLSAVLDGVIGTTSITTAGSDYTDGSYFLNVTGGNGQRAVAGITVVGGVVTVFSVSPSVSQRPGYQYEVGDVLSFDPPDGEGSGFTATVLTLAAPTGSGFTWTVGTVTSGLDPLDIASKTGALDNLVTIEVVHREIWLIGKDTTEVHYNTGAADFTFGIMPGVFIQHGCIAKYSVARWDLQVFWLGNDPEGHSVVLMGQGYSAVRISTFALEKAIQSYAIVDDAIGWVYQQDGHTFYVLQFPSADRTWVYDIATSLWHERVTIDGDGEYHQWRALHYVNAHGRCLTFNRSTGQLYRLDLDSFTDVGDPVVRVRSFAHLVSGDNFVTYEKFIAHMETGEAVTGPGPLVTLKWSDDGGKSYGNGVTESLGAAGEYAKSLLWQRLGLARDRVFELSWSSPWKTALLGAMLKAEECNG